MKLSGRIFPTLLTMPPGLAGEVKGSVPLTCPSSWREEKKAFPQKPKVSFTPLTSLECLSFPCLQSNFAGAMMQGRVRISLPGISSWSSDLPSCPGS